MAVLRNVLETLPLIDASLEAFNKSGHIARKVSGRELVEHVRSFRSSLRRGKLGRCEIRGRKVVALLFRPEETVEFLVAAFAALAERFTVVPLYPNWSPDTQRQYLEAYGIRELVTGSGFQSRVTPWQRDVLDAVLTVDLDSPPAKPTVIENEPEGTEDELESIFPQDLPADHPCAWIFTSGTSGRLAKLTEITLGNLEAAIENIAALDFLYPGMTLHSPLSTSHIFAFVVVLGFLAIKPRRLLFSDIQYLARLPQSRTGKINGLILVPIVLNRLRARFYEQLVAVADGGPLPEEMKQLARIPLAVRKVLKRVAAAAEEAAMLLETRGKIGARGWAALKLARTLFGRKIRERLGSPDFVVVGGAKPSLASMAFLEVMGIRCLQGWGMTETTGPLAVCRPRDRFRGAFGTCGKLFARTLATLDDGELIVEGPQIAHGYMEPSGRFVSFHGKKRTGDLAEFDTEGRLKILGKSSDRITTDNGINYNPIPFEERLTALDLEREHLLEEVIVVGDGQPRLGAVFFLREGIEGCVRASKTVEPRDYVRRLLKEFNVERAVDERVEAWTISTQPFKEAGLLGPSGKLIRRLAEERYADMFPVSAAVSER